MKTRRIAFLISALFLFSGGVLGQECVQPPGAVLDVIGTYSNELEGFEFLRNSKFSSLTVGVSTREDVLRLLGEPKSKTPDYDHYQVDDVWTLYVGYFSERQGWTFTTTQPIGNRIVETRRSVSSAPASYGKIKYLQFNTETSQQLKKEPDSDQFFTNIKQDSRFNVQFYWSANGLTYNVFESFRSEDQVNKYRFKKGDVLFVRYDVSCPVRRGLLLEKVEKKELPQ